MNTMLSIGAGLAQGLEKSTNTLMGVMKAKYELTQAKELLDLKKKSIESDTELLPFQKAHYTAQIDSNKAHIAYYTAVAQKAQDEADYNKKQMEKGLYNYSKTLDPAKVVMEKVRMNGVDSLTPGERAVWDRGAKSGGGSLLDTVNDELGSADTTEPSTKAKSDEWWNQ